MIRILTTSLVALALGAGAALASGAAPVDHVAYETIRASLTGQGYEVRKIETDDGLYEAYALKDGKRYEIYLDAGMKIVKTKIDE